jgi:hypothetical protein
VLVVLLLGGCKPQRKIRVRHSTAPPAATEPEPDLTPPPVRPAPPPPTAAALPPPTHKPRPAEPEPVKEKPSLCGRGGTGERFAVHGVDPSDTLNVRAEPDPQSEVVGQLPAGTSGVRALGERQQVGPSVWRKVECGTLRGWVNGKFLAAEGERR